MKYYTQARRRSWLKIVTFISFMILLFAAAGGYLTYHGVVPQIQSKNDSTTGNEVPVKTIESLKSHIQAQFVDDARNYYEDTSDTNKGGVVLYKIDSDYLVESTLEPKAAVYYKVNTTDAASKNATSSQQELEPLVESVDEYLTRDLGFKKIDTVKDNTIKNNDLAIYLKDDTYCQVGSPRNLTVAIDCVDRSRLQSASTKIKPFAELYMQTGQTSRLFGLPEVINGKNGYRIAHMVSDRAGRALVFLLDPVTSQWSYFNAISVQSEDECKIYESTSAGASAFEGTTCYENGEPSKPGGPPKQTLRTVRRS